MKLKKKKVLESISDNKNVIFGVFIIVLVFSICLLPLMRKGTYSTGDYSFSLTCPDTANVGETIGCSIEILSTITAYGISANYDLDEGLVYKELVEDDAWKTSEEVNYKDDSGFILISDGVDGESYVGELRIVMPSDAEVDEVYKIGLVNPTIGDGEDTEITFDDLYANVTIVAKDSELSDVNTLDSITLSIGTLNETFDKNNTVYSANVNSEKVTIEVETTDPNSVVSGDVGEVTLEYGINDIEIVVTSESGLKNTYKITITRKQDESEKDEASIVFDSSVNVNEENKYILYMKEGTTVSDLLDKIEVVDYEVKVYSSDASLKENSSVLFTGDMLLIYLNGEEVDQYEISVMGDSNGDGAIDLIDLVQMRKHIVGWVHPETNEVQRKTGIYYYSLDFNQDGIIDLIDLVRMRKTIVGML